MKKKEREPEAEISQQANKNYTSSGLWKSDFIICMHHKTQYPESMTSFFHCFDVLMKCFSSFTVYIKQIFI